MSGFLYVLQTPDYFGTDVFKVGRTAEAEPTLCLRRLTEYPGNSQLLLVRAVPLGTEVTIEARLIESLALTFERVRRNEWFRAPREELLSTVLSGIEKALAELPPSGPGREAKPGTKPPLPNYQVDPKRLEVILCQLYHNCEETGVARCFSRLWRAVHRADMGARSIQYWARDSVEGAWAPDPKGARLRARLHNEMRTSLRRLGRDYIGKARQALSKEQPTPCGPTGAPINYETAKKFCSVFESVSSRLQKSAYLDRVMREFALLSLQEPQQAHSRLLGPGEPHPPLAPASQNDEMMVEG